MVPPTQIRLQLLILAAFFTLLPAASQSSESLLVSSLATNEIFSFDGQTGEFNEKIISSPSLIESLRGLTIGPDGDIYACSYSANRIFRFDGNSGCFKDTFIGDQVPAMSEELFNSVDLAFGPNGDLYVLSASHGLFRYDGSTGAYIEHLIQIDNGNFYELYVPSSLAMDIPNNRILISDLNNGSILSFNASTGVFNGYFVAPYSNGLDAPRSITFGPDNNLYVSSLTNDGAVLRFNGSTGSFINIFVDHGTGGLDWPEGAIFGPDGDFYVSDFNSDRILKFAGASGAPLGEFISSGNNGLDEPYGLLFGQNGNLLVAADATGLMIFQGQTGDFLNLAANGLQLGIPRGMTLGPDGILYISDTTNDEIQRFDPHSGCFIDHFVAQGDSPMTNPRDLVFGPDGNLFVVTFSGVYRFDGTTGIYLDLFVPADYGSEYELYGPAALVFGPDDNLYICDMNNGSVIRFNGTSGAYIDDFVQPYSGNLDAPRKMVFGPDGHLYVCSLYDNGTVFRFHGTTGSFMDIFVNAGYGGLGQPEDLIFGQDGNLYVSDISNHQVLKYNGSTGSFAGAVDPSGSANLTSPYNLLFVEDSGVSAADHKPNRPPHLLQANYPNPFNPSTRIRYLVPKSGPVRLAIFDMKGNLVTTLADGQRDAGRHEVTWRGMDQEGRKVPSGQYFYRLDTGRNVETRKMVLLK